VVTAACRNAQQAQSRIAGAEAAIAREQRQPASALKQVDLLKGRDRSGQMQRSRVLKRCKARPNSISTTPRSSRRSTALSAIERCAPASSCRPAPQLMSVVPVAGAYVVANFKETQLTDVRAGQAVDIAVDMFPGQVGATVRVDSIAPPRQEFALLPAGQCHRQLHQGRAAIREDRARPGQRLSGRTAPGHVT